MASTQLLVVSAKKRLPVNGMVTARSRLKSSSTPPAKKAVVALDGGGEVVPVDASGLAQLLGRGALEQPALILELLDGGIVVHALHHVLVEHLEAAGAVTGLGILRVGHALERQILAHEALASGLIMRPK